MSELHNARNNLAEQRHRLPQGLLRSASITTAQSCKQAKHPATPVKKGNPSQKSKSSYSHVVMSAAATESFFKVSRFMWTVFIALVLLIHISVGNRAIVLGKRMCLVTYAR